MRTPGVEPGPLAGQDPKMRMPQLESPIEYEMHLLLDQAKLRSELVAQQPIPVGFVRRTGVVNSLTTPDFTHGYRRLVIFCDGSHHGELRTREIDNGVVEALQARGYVVLRLTGREILEDGALCLARIRRALAPRGKSGGQMRRLAGRRSLPGSSPAPEYTSLCPGCRALSLH